jgi:glycosyltransferase involved in cell wall biosynthesis
MNRQANTENSTLTILVCTHNRADLLFQTLRHLYSADQPSEWDVDILVVANACTDNTVPTLERFAEENPDGYPIRWIEEPRCGKSNALNSAMPHVSSSLVAFVDDDHRIAGDYLVNICSAALDYPDADLFCGRILPDWNGTEPTWVHDSGPYRIYPLPVPRFDQGNAPQQLTPDIAIPGGGNLFLRSEWLARVGDFSTELGPTGHNLGGSEDLDWVLRAQKLGARLQYIPSVVQYHYVDGRRLTLTYLLRKAYTRSASTIGIKGSIVNHVPLYLYRKLGEYLLFALTSLRSDRRRFYLVRTAAALGEMKGYRKSAGVTQTINSGEC